MILFGLRHVSIYLWKSFSLIIFWNPLHFLPKFRTTQLCHTSVYVKFQMPLFPLFCGQKLKCMTQFSGIQLLLTDTCNCLYLLADMLCYLKLVVLALAEAKNLLSTIHHQLFRHFQASWKAYFVPARGTFHFSRITLIYSWEASLISLPPLGWLGQLCLTAC